MRWFIGVTLVGHVQTHVETVPKLKANDTETLSVNERSVAVCALYVVLRVRPDIVLTSASAQHY